MTTRVIKGSRRAAAHARACIPLTKKYEERERLLEVWDFICIKSNRVISRLFYFLFSIVKSFMWPINFGECTLAKMFINVVSLSHLVMFTVLNTFYCHCLWLVDCQACPSVAASLSLTAQTGCSSFDFSSLLAEFAVLKMISSQDQIKLLVAMASCLLWST